MHHNYLPDLRRRAYLAATLNTALLAACGGGGGGAPVPPPAVGGPGDVPPPPPLPPGWQGAELVHGAPQPGSTQPPDLAMNLQGHAVAVRVHSNTKIVSGYRHAPGKPWSGPFNVDDVTPITPHFMHSARVAVDGEGNAIFVWIHEHTLDGDGARISARRFSPSGESLEFVELQDSNFNFRPIRPNVAVNASGGAVALWVEQDEFFGRLQIRANHFTPADSWDETYQVIADMPDGGANLMSTPQIAVASDGSALAVWAQRRSGVNSVMARPYVEGQWADAQLIGFYNNSSDIVLPEPSMALGVDGKAVVVWAESLTETGVRKRIMARRAHQFAANDWAPAELIQTDATGHAQNPRVTLDVLGNATVVWEQQRRLADGSVMEDIEANRFDGTAWLAAQQRVNVPAGGASTPQIASDASGNAMVVWKQTDGSGVGVPRNDIFASRLNAATLSTWSAPELLEKNDVEDATGPQIAMDAAGNAVSVWEQPVGGADSLFANVFRDDGNPDA